MEISEHTLSSPRSRNSFIQLELWVVNRKPMRAKGVSEKEDKFRTLRWSWRQRGNSYIQLRLLGILFKDVL